MSAPGLCTDNQQAEQQQTVTQNNVNHDHKIKYPAFVDKVTILIISSCYKTCQFS